MIKTYDTMASSGYIRFSHSPVAVTRELSSEVVCDFDANNKLI